MTLGPDELYAEFRRAELYLKADQPTEAARLLDPVVEAAPEHTAALELLARALFASAQLARAEEALRLLVERRPDDSWARMALARSLERQGKSAEARVHRKMAEALGQDDS
jgi:Flp pilus assembly protein TadD